MFAPHTCGNIGFDPRSNVGMKEVHLRHIILGRSFQTGAIQMIQMQVCVGARKQSSGQIIGIH